MKKFTLAIAIILCTNTVNAEPKNGFDTNNKCYLETNGTDSAWFCGKQSKKCKQTMKKRHHIYWKYHGDGFTYGKVTAWCCNGTTTAQGHFVEQKNWITRESVTVQLENGTCTYIKQTTACGEVLSTPCTTPTSCTGGHVLRNNECTEPCNLNDGDSAYESRTSNTCVTCNTTNTQGIDANGVCVKCNSATQFWDTQTKKCIEKNTLTPIPAAIMKKCWQCPGNEIFEKCIRIMNLPKDKRTTQPEYKSITSECKITDS